MSKQIPLTKGLFAIVDDDDYESLSRHKWYALHANKPGRFYAARSRLPGHNFMHREVLGLNDYVTPLVDHRDGNGLNNQKSNLRPCTHKQNLWNGRPSSRTGFKGVSPVGKNFKATIRCSGVTHYLGFFTKAEDGARAYDQAAKRLFGEFAYQNFPETKASAA